MSKYDHLFDNVNRGSNYDYLVKKSDNLTKRLAKLTQGERYHESRSLQRCNIREKETASWKAVRCPISSDKWL
jgi:hypothetical protein